MQIQQTLKITQEGQVHVGTSIQAVQAYADQYAKDHAWAHCHIDNAQTVHLEKNAYFPLANTLPEGT